MPLRLAASALLLCLLSACSSEDPVVVLADYRFDPRLVHADDPLPVLDGERDHRLESGWEEPSEQGRWLQGPAARIRLVLVGRDLRLHLACATHPELAARGQGALLRLNGKTFARLKLTEGWTLVDTTFAVPDSLVRQGGNLLEIRPDHAFTQGEKAGKALFVRRLTVTARAGAADLEKLRRARGLERLETEYALRKVGRLVPVDAPPQPPDVLMILLDAARPDHFGCYGYERNTTPFIDTLAERGVRFEQVVAPAPYTLCSVPTILTGRHWLEHGVVRAGARLGDDLPTLAGMLGEAGYHTTAFSENPWVSEAMGLERGFDTFTESWGLSLQSGETPVEQVLAALKNFPDNQPVFAYVHLIPPHQPYVPPTEHDIFADHAYAGPADGSTEYLADIDSGRQAWSSDDRDHLVDLYDGHLHWADDGVRRMVESWQATNRSRPLLTVILSDHGEAFGEHDRFLHNSTLYEEMLRVPLIFHPRELAAALPAAHRLRGLEDVAPMILRCLGVRPDPERTWPRHFLDAWSGRDRSRRHILVRTGDEAEFGLRTQHYLASFRTRDDQELYDLVQDPGQSTNRRDGQPLLYLEMVNTARRLRAETTPMIEGGRQAAMDSSDVARLRALGY